MLLIVHDGDKEYGEKLCQKFAEAEEEVKVITDDGTITRCVGCFECWVKTPGQCVIEDKYGKMGEWLGHTDRMIIVSQCVYGGYSPFVKNVMDRSISYVNPDFVMRHGEIHHKLRYKNQVKFEVYLYGSVLPEEKKIAESTIHAHQLNFNGGGEKIVFMATKEDVLKEVQA